MDHSGLRARRPAPEKPEPEDKVNAVEAYNKLLADIQATVVEMYPGLTCLGTNKLASSTALEFESQMTDVDIDSLYSAIRLGHGVSVRCQVRSRSHATVLIVCVPLQKHIKWGFCERLSAGQLFMIAQTLFIALVLIPFLVYTMRHLVSHDDPSA